MSTRIRNYSHHPKWKTRTFHAWRIIKTYISTYHLVYNLIVIVGSCSSITLRGSLYMEMEMILRVMMMMMMEI